jgi:hypothetical protein
LFFPTVLFPVVLSAERHRPIIVRLLPDARIDLRGALIAEPDVAGFGCRIVKANNAAKRSDKLQVMFILLARLSHSHAASALS